MAEYVGVKEAAEILDLSKRTIYKKLRKGDLPGQKVETKTGSKWQINKNDLKIPPTVNNEVIEVKEKQEIMSKNELKQLIVELDKERNKELNNKIDKLEKKLEEMDKKLDKKQENPIKRFLKWLYY